MIAFHKRNFPLHHCMGARKNFCREGGVKPKKVPYAHGEKVAKNWQKGPHMKEKASHKENKRGFFPGGGGKGLLCPPCWHQCFYSLNNHIYFLKRTFLGNIFQDAPNCTINTHCGVCSHTPKYSAQ